MNTHNSAGRWAPPCNAEERERRIQTAKERAARRLREESEDYNKTRGTLNQEDGYDCPLCLNRGMIMHEDGAISFCVCRSTRKSLRRLRQLGLDVTAGSLTFSSYIASAPWQQKLLSAAQRYSEQETPPWLFLGGQSGCGKTHLCTAAAVALCRRGMELHYMRWMHDSMRLKGLALDERRTQELSAFIDAPVLYIDDFFKTPPTEADKHLAFELLDARYGRADRPTILSSERTITELFEIDEAIAGRIAERAAPDFLLSIGRDRAKNYRLAQALQ